MLALFLVLLVPFLVVAAVRIVLGLILPPFAMGAVDGFMKFIVVVSVGALVVMGIFMG